VDGVLGSFFLIKPLFIYVATVDPPELFNLGNSLCNTTVYQRIPGKVLLDGEDMNLEQIEAGLAWHYKYHQREQRAADRVWTGPEGTQPEWVERTLRWATVDLWQPVLEARGGTPFQRLLSALHKNEDDFGLSDLGPGGAIAPAAVLSDRTRLNLAANLSLLQEQNLFVVPIVVFRTTDGEGHMFYGVPATENLNRLLQNVQ